MPSCIFHCVIGQIILYPDTLSSLIWTSRFPHQGLTVEGGQAAWDGEFVFVQMADTQLGLEWDNQKWDHEAQLATEAVRHINSIKPKFAIICGDLVNYLPVLYPNHPYVCPFPRAIRFIMHTM